MKYLIIFFLSVSISCYSQTKRQLESQIKYMISEQEKLNQEISSLKEQISEMKLMQNNVVEDNQQLNAELKNQGALIQKISSSQVIENKSIASSYKRCQAITAKGTQCSRNASEGSDYCWQHQKVSKSSEIKTTTKASKINSGSSSGTPLGGGRTILTGPRGGKYYINSHGNKTYVKH